jgi:hypothetical protein
VDFSLKLQEIREGFQPAFWVANTTELFERLSYYGVNAVLAASSGSCPSSEELSPIASDSADRLPVRISCSPWDIFCLAPSPHPGWLP